MPELARRGLWVAVIVGCVLSRTQITLGQPSLPRRGNLPTEHQPGIETVYERLIDFERRQLEAVRLSRDVVTERVTALAEFYTLFLLQKKTPADVIRERPRLASVWKDGPGHQYGRSARFHHQLAQLNPTRGWSKVRVPTLAIWSEQDIVMHRQDHERLVAMINANAPRAARLVTAPGDHGMSTKGPDGRRVLPPQVPSAIREFLAQFGPRHLRP